MGAVTAVYVAGETKLQLHAEQLAPSYHVDLQETMRPAAALHAVIDECRDVDFH